MTGFKNPPEHTRFKAGQSGNPRGRPARGHSLRDEVGALLTESTEGGKTNLRQIAEALITKSANGDLRAIALIVKMQAEEPESEWIEPEHSLRTFMAGELNVPVTDSDCGNNQSHIDDKEQT